MTLPCSIRWLVVLAACISFAPAARAEPATSPEAPSTAAFEVGLGLGVALHSSARYSSLGAALPATLELGVRWPTFHFGAYGAYAPIFTGHCSGNCPTESSGYLRRAGVLARGVLTAGSFRPWIGGQVGLSVIKTRETFPRANGTASFEGGDTGFDFGAWVGIDAPLSRALAIGPYFLVDYTAVWGDTGTPGIVWFSLGMRGTVDLEL